MKPEQKHEANIVWEKFVGLLKKHGADDSFFGNLESRYNFDAFNENTSDDGVAAVYVVVVAEFRTEVKKHYNFWMESYSKIVQDVLADPQYEKLAKRASDLLL